jgi:hypothetical protein
MEGKTTKREISSKISKFQEGFLGLSSVIGVRSEDFSPQGRIRQKRCARDGRKFRCSKLGGRDERRLANRGAVVRAQP